MNWGPDAKAIGIGEPRSRSTTFETAGSQCRRGPSGVADQSCAATSSAHPGRTGCAPAACAGSVGINEGLTPPVPAILERVARLGHSDDAAPAIRPILDGTAVPW